jgi:hypothetical protein
MFDFPSSPTNGQKYPASPIANIPTYTWDGEKWTTVGASIGSSYVAKTGDTMTGDLEISKSSPLLVLRKSAAVQYNTVAGYNGAGVAGKRWELTFGNNAAESGSNAGSDFVVSRYGDTGTWLGDPIAINRSTGQVTFSAPSLTTAAEYLSNSAPTKVLTSGAVWGAAATVFSMPSAPVAAPDFSQGCDFWWPDGSLGRTLNNPTNLKVGQKGLIYLNGGSITTWGSYYKFSGGIKPTITAGGQDALSYVVANGNSVWCSLAADFR